MGEALDSALNFLINSGSGSADGVRGRESLHLSDTYSQFRLNYTGSKDDLLSLVAKDRINSTTRFFTWEPPPEGTEDYESLQKYTKSEKFSTLFRESGNRFYCQRRFRLALREYNLAIMFGRPDEVELVLAYGNRSAILLEMGHPRLSLRDIDSVLKSTACTAQLEEKLLKRKRKCDELLLRSASIQAEALQYPAFTLERPSRKVRRAESFLKIDFSEDCGRKLVVTEHVPCGRVLLIERPFAVSLENELSFDTEHCHLCLVKSIAGIPCPHCPFAMYCSLECLEEAAKSFHQYEHRILGYFHSQGMRQRDLLILRIICTAGPQKLWELFKSDFNADLASGRTRIKGEDPETGVYESGYFQILHLLSHSHHRKDSGWGFDSIFRSFLLVSLLVEYSDFFSNLTEPDSEMTAFKNFISSLILEHYENTPYNAVAFNELENDEEKLDGLCSIPFGTGIFPTISLINHSCAPNAIHVRGRKGCETAVISLRALNPGDEITITYGPRFTLSGRKQRQAELERKYNFLCRCVACEENWPISSSGLVPIKCPTCGNQNFISCSTCSEIRSRVGLLEAIHDKLSKNYGNAQNDPRILNDLAACIEFFDTKFFYYFQYTQIAEELFKKALLLGSTSTQR